jgi:hypothetical protein
MAMDEKARAALAAPIRCPVGAAKGYELMGDWANRGVP